MLQIQSESEIHSKLRIWLDAPDPSTNYHAAFRLRQQGTGSWLLCDNRFVDWNASQGSCLWLHGIPGCGKTVLSATIIDHQTKNHPNSVVAYFYFDFNDDGKRKVNKCLRSLLMQLASQIPEGLHALQSLHMQCKGREQPQDSALLPMLDLIIQRTKYIYIILDALDECEDRTELLDFVEGLVEKHQSSLHFLATSRRERDIEERIQPIMTSAIDIISSTVDEDIALYVESCLQNDPRLRKWPMSVRDEIKETLAHKAQRNVCASHRVGEILTNRQKVQMGVLPTRIPSQVYQAIFFAASTSKSTSNTR